MCIAIYCPAGKEVPFEHLIEGQGHNPDGCGLGWVEDGAVQVFKTMDFNEFTVKYLDIIDRLGNIDMLIHFRITSRGETREDMCHPFMVNDDMCIIHNGTIANIKAAETTNGVSDTYVLANTILANLPKGWEYNAAICRLLEDYVGYSKVCILTNESKVYILNETSGHWENDIWYSNKSYISYKRPATVTNLPARTTADNWDYYDKFKNNNSLYEDECDCCLKTYKYSQMSSYRAQLLCDTCLIKARRQDAETHKALFGATTYRPCASCRSMEDVDDMWELEVEFIENLDATHRVEMLEEFQADLVLEHDKYADVGVMHVCEDCYLKIMIQAPSEAVIAVEVINYPIKYTNEELENLFS